jgi:hypothetical protein
LGQSSQLGKKRIGSLIKCTQRCCAFGASFDVIGDPRKHWTNEFAEDEAFELGSIGATFRVHDSIPSPTMGQFRNAKALQLGSLCSRHRGFSPLW